MLDRTALIHELADRACESIDLKDLLSFYYENQTEYMIDLSDEELCKYAEDFGGLSLDELEEDCRC